MNLNKNAKLIYLTDYYSLNEITEHNLKWLLESNKLNEQFNFELDSRHHFSIKYEGNFLKYSHIIENYLDKKIKENFKNEDKITFNQLVNLGFNVHQTFEENIYYGENAIFTHLKSKAYSPEYIKFLINNNFDINNQDSSGKTLLLTAIFNQSHPILIKVLMMFGANPYIKDDANLDVFDYLKIFNVENIYQNALSFEEDYNYDFIHIINEKEFELKLEQGIENIDLTFRLQNLFKDENIFDEYIQAFKEQNREKQETLLTDYLLIPQELKKRMQLNEVFLNARQYAQEKKLDNFISLTKKNLNNLLSYNDPIINEFILKENIFQLLSQESNAFQILNESDENSSSPIFKIISSKNKELIKSFFNLNIDLINLNQKTDNGATIAKKLLYCLQDEAFAYYEKYPQLLDVLDNDGTNLLSHVVKKSKYNIAKKLLQISPYTFNQKDHYGLQAKDYIESIAYEYFTSEDWNNDIDIDKKMYADFQLAKDNLKVDFEKSFLFLTTQSNMKSKEKILKL